MNILSVFLLMWILIKMTKGNDPFESFLIRPQCYEMNQPGCSKDFIDAYPKLSMSYNNLTRADTFLYLFTPKNIDQPELLHKCDDVTPPQTNFNPKCKTEIIMPGFLTGVCNVAGYREVKNELLKKGCYNVILVDYMWGDSFDPTEGMLNGRIVARQLAKVIQILKKKYHLSSKDFVCSGISLGAHICGFIGQKTRLGVINGLDPSGSPIQKKTPLNQRLDPSDADCVQVLHTNAGGCFPALGCNFSCGTVDIWINGGLEQKAAQREALVHFLKGDFVYATLNLGIGSHLQAMQYYKASINAKDCKFIAISCKSYDDYKNGKCSSCGRKGNQCILVGADACDCLRKKKSTKVRKHRRGYYLSTNETCPYCSNAGLNTTRFHCTFRRQKHRTA
ncbi:inactive pancreatic lipase-related protein 1-like [Uloborus diversus]|uniref:inactive pancreatic lipase-related protein 1-like n=1 Tax=Uloborus diversus TaxID=327109 RepID=UPI00240A5F5F|nr:inactive pancreatic lipase-related protein 1-like [Uloborus diversus]